MSHIPFDNIEFPDNRYDSFGRMRVSDPFTIFDAKFRYGIETWFDTTLVGGGTLTHLPNESSFKLEVGTAAGDLVERMTPEKFKYLPGKSQLITMSFVFNAPKTNLKQMAGSGDYNNGIFLVTDDLDIGFILRSSTSGAPVGLLVPQEEWNIDRLDGGASGDLNPSGLTLDISQSQILVIDLQWLGVGRVRVGLDIGGQLIICHEFLNSNINDKVYITSPDLPLTYRIENTGTTSSSSSMKQICSSVTSEGGYEQRGFLRTKFLGNDSIVLTTTPIPLISFRLKDTVNGVVNQGIMKFIDLDVLPASNGKPIHLALVENANLTGDNFISSSSDSVVKIDTTATVITDGTELVSRLASGNKVIDSFANDDIKLIPGKTFTIVGHALAANIGIWLTVNWREIY